MTDDRHRRVIELFTEALGIPAERRRRFVDARAGADTELAAEVHAMLAADAQGAERLDVGAASALGALDDDLPGLELPMEFAGFVLQSELGRGAMGRVFLARQSSPSRNVAIKLMTNALVAGSDDRFALEAELLGRLGHPGIAQVYGAGVAQLAGTAQPYIAMEFVEGLPLDEYARAADLNVGARIALIAQICDAVQHAHQKGVLHRDLKPANILVSASGQPKVLDFGIGRAMERDAGVRTSPGTLLGTLGYMSPEQVEGLQDQIDTRADIYALGAIAYELTSGKLPIDVDDVGLTEAARRICDTAPLPLGHRMRELGGDLEIVIAKALAKEPDQRYASAEAYADDLRRYLDREPVAARRPTLRYRCARFVTRNRALTTAIAVATIALIAGAGLSIHWALRSEDSATRAEQARVDSDRQRQKAVAALAIAERETQTNTEVLAFVESLFSAAMPAVADGDDLTARQLVATGREGLVAKFAPGTQVGARLQAFFANVLLAVGDYAAARDSLESVVPILERHETRADPRVLQAKANLAQILARSEPDAARAIYDEILPLAQRAGLPRIVARCSTGLAYIARASEDFDRAETHFTAAVAAHDAVDDLPGTATERARARIELASIYNVTDRLAESRTCLDEAMAIAGTDTPKLFRSALHTTLANLAWREGDPEKAKASSEKSLELAEEALPANHPTLVQLLLNAAGTSGATGDIPRARQLLDRAVAIAESEEGVPPEAHAQALHNLGMCHASEGDLGSALDVWQRALERYEAAAGPDSMAAATLYGAMAQAHRSLGQEDKATELEARAASIRDKRP